MAVMIGSARIDERGKATGGMDGDNNGREVSTQSYYVRSASAPWRVLRAKDAGQAAQIAECMRRACENDNIGYNQSRRLTLYNLARPLDFDVSRVTTPCATDCSALVRVCCAFAGINVANFTTSDEAKLLLATGAFVELTASKYRTGSAYLREGDILVTPSKGHTVVVLNDGKYAEKNVPAVTEYKLGDRLLKNGCVGTDVKELQEALIRLGISCGDYGADGEFGDCTEMAVIAYQKQYALEADGEYGPLTHASLTAELERLENPLQENCVRIVGGNCYVRVQPNTDAEKLGVAHRDTLLPYQGETSANSWLKVSFAGRDGWVSGKYGRICG